MEWLELIRMLHPYMATRMVLTNGCDGTLQDALSLMGTERVVEPRDIAPCELRVDLFSCRTRAAPDRRPRCQTKRLTKAACSKSKERWRRGSLSLQHGRHRFVQPYREACCVRPQRLYSAIFASNDLDWRIALY
jgi:hypothetical protein